MYADIRSLTRELATVIKRGSERVRTRSLLVSADRDSILLQVCDWAITGGQDASVQEDVTNDTEVVEVPYVCSEDDGESESDSQTTFDSLESDDRSTLYNSSFDQSGRTSPDAKHSFFDHSHGSVTATLPRSPVVAQRERRTHTHTHTFDLKAAAELEEQVDILHHQNGQLEEEVQHALEQSRNEYLVHLRVERANWKGRFDILKEAANEIELKLHSSEAARLRLEQRLLDAAREREMLQAQLEEEQSEQSRLKRRLADTHTQLRRRCSEMEDLVVRINAAAEETSSRVAAERDSALAANVIARHAISVLEKEKAEGKALALDIWDEYERVRSAETSARVREQERDDALALVSDLQGQVSDLNEQLQAAHGKCEVLEQEVLQLRHEATRQEREAEEEEETRRMEAQRQVELEASRKRMQQMLEEETQRKQRRNALSRTNGRNESVESENGEQDGARRRRQKKNDAVDETRRIGTSRSVNCGPTRRR
ncbi:uncharacterized protein BT62DRAFT_630215 [Guyanagaster necrorhizus]|uniref:Uncharacterized protein n=1 Tax=Guyanagaster necrorhizus TaxID=856835 RepID=A0A9P7VGL6_9AGAR|nr:uncharacterized protein BT62DRAFT_630215 [Guyanagaster necrorhizus MCA 3950]KAG7440349.1 hypothetical protein BT62DRAFT_630215 [Guyanagaster necrorhizus MCA 3950]